MKPSQTRFASRGCYLACAAVALAVLLPTLLMTPAARADSLSEATETAQAAVAEIPNGIYVPWDNNILSSYILRFRAWFAISVGRNVAAVELYRPGDSLVIVGSSAGTQVKRENRNAIFDVYHNGILLTQPPRDEWLNGKFANGGNFDSETLIMRYIQQANLLAVYRPTKVYVVSELPYCAICAGAVDSVLADVPYVKYRNFPIPSPRLDDIENNPALSFEQKRDQARILAIGQKNSIVGKWTRHGMLINGQPAGVSPATLRLITDQTLKIRQLVADCAKESSVGKPGENGGPALELVAFASSNACASSGKGSPGGLVKALTSGDLGGVDFSTLQMRYMSDDPDSTGLQYSFAGQQATSADPQDIGTALKVLTDNAADLRTWLVLNPDKFWVNLNPSEPDRIIDPQLGQTNAGRELLDADFQLKHSSAALLNPKTALGAQYWRELAGSSSDICYGSRMWIVPGQVQVREDSGSLYILKAQLTVKAVTDNVAGMPAGCHDAQSDARGQRLDQTLIVPRITAMVNTAPEYAPIRRAFMARIVAQWIRERHANGEHTSFDRLIDSGDIGPAKLQDGWRPQQVFNAYVKSVNDGEFTYTMTTQRGDATYLSKFTFGGVDFTGLHPTEVSAEQMSQDHPQLPQAAKSSVSQLTSADGSLWLGDTLAPPSGRSAWASFGASVRSFTAGRTGILILVLAALGVVAIGIRRGSKHRRKPAGH